ncbi:MAG: D-glycero-beta-D-manno-heptose 1,7-bisphosphate 7-phosphatase [Anaerolineae bacterium]|nr:D-glycero-beta-D-manno-heptose 1,7-bisphosphate 7-phosphatase [Anaerolineae bacterium]
MGKAAVFLDRDGVINENRPDYVKTWGEFVFLPGVMESLRRLAQSDLLIVVITNQSAIGRGLVSLEEAKAINHCMVEEIEWAGGRVDGVFMCPHRPDEGCDCRKPRPGLLRQAAEKLDVDLKRSFLVGDALSDVEAARAAGCQPILVLTGRGREQLTQQTQGCPVVPDLAAAVEHILRCQVQAAAPGPLSPGACPGQQPGAHTGRAASEASRPAMRAGDASLADTRR